MASKSAKIALDELEKQNMSQQLEIFQKLYTIWETVGIDEEQELNRATQVWNYILDLLNDIKEEEISLFEEIKERVINYEKKISVLNSELQLPEAEGLSGSLIEKEETLRQLLDKLSKIKHKRLKELQELRLQQSKLCKVMGALPLNISTKTGVPSENDIHNLQQHIKMLQEEKEIRQQKFLKLKNEFSTILKVTELTPESLFEKEILTNQEETEGSLSVETLKQLEEVINKIKKKQADLEYEKFTLMEKLLMLWDSLKTDTKEREEFLSKHTDCRISNLNALKEEITRCTIIKKQNFTEYLSSLKRELSSLLDQCFILPSNNILPQIEEDENSETILENYENELIKWKKYYKDIEHLSHKISKRKELWDQMIIFENKGNDPNRFKNRGGNLLREEKQRKQLQKMLSKLEEEIIVDIHNYEKETGKQFLYFGEKFEDFMKKQLEDRLNQKENEKLARQNMRLKEIINEQSVRKTPCKQSFSVMTPKSASSRFLKSSIGICKTPKFSVPRQSPCIASCLKNEKKTTNSTKTTQKSILKEKYGNKHAASKCLNSTTYADFASKLNRSSRAYHRSSFLSSKACLGKRTSINKSMNKKNNKSIRKSLRKK